MPNVWDIEDYRVKDIVDKQFDDARVNLIDFKRHLRYDVALQKSVVLREDGRPEVANYYHGATLIARIYFYFIIDGNNLIQRKTTRLTYIKNDGTEGPQVTLEDRTFGAADTAGMFDEQVQARAAICAQIKKSILEALVWTHYPTYTLAQIVGMGATFVQASEPLRAQFEEYGYPFYKNFIAACDPTAPGYEWLATPIGGGATLQDYMLDALTFEALSNHPDA